MHDNIFRQEGFFFSWKRNLVVLVITVLQQAHLGKAPCCWAISANFLGVWGPWMVPEHLQEM